jgi:hypothetical protein
MHTIRLRGPWQLEATKRFVVQADGSYRAAHDDLPPAAEAKMPADWSAVLGANFFGRVRYTRSFNKPTGLDSGERVFLVVEPPRSEACVLLHGQPVGSVRAGDDAGRFDITERLESHNRLEIIVDHPALDEMRSVVGDPAELPPGGLVSEVRLEIEESEFATEATEEELE